MKKVLIALDYGISARKIAEQGYNLAKSMKAKVTLLHVVADETYYSSIDAGPFMGFYGYDFFNMDDKNTLMESSLHFLEKIKSHLKDPDIEIMAEKGDFSSVILDVATRNHSSIIVLGAHSKNWLVRTVMGSVTESVLSDSKIPMFIIPVKE